MPTKADELNSLVSSWPNPELAALAVTNHTRTIAGTGQLDRVSGVASISKVLVALVAMVAVEEGSVELDEPAGPEGATVRHLLSHASGLTFDEEHRIAEVGARRIYSNSGIERFAGHLEDRTGIPFAQYLYDAVTSPLGMDDTRLEGSPAQGVVSSVADLTLMARELLTPTLVHPDTLAEATSCQFPELRGVVPGFGSFDPNPWGLGLEIRGHKHPHWTAPGNSPQTYGHFGATGTYMWIDPAVGLAAVAISGTPYGPWANEHWPVTNQAILDRYSGSPRG